MKKIVITLMLLFFSFSFLASAYASPVLVGGNSNVTANFSASPSSGVAPLSVQFNDLSTGSPTAWEWNFGDGYTSKERNPTHTYSSGGIYTVTFSVSAGTDTDTETVTINVGTASNPPVAAFSASPISGNAPLTVAFTDTSTGSPTSWLWNFGDGTTSTFQSPSHTYYGVGTYTVSLTVKDVAGSTATKSNYITVTSVTPTILPVAAFSASAVSGNAPLTVTFTDKSTGSPTSWIWDFGDGTTYNIQNPPHIYTQAGIYTVKLTVSNAFGSNTLESKSLINVLPSTPSQKTTPTITWSKPADVTFGTPLSSTQLNAVASVPGTFLYNPISGTILNAGTWTLYAVFIPTDVGNYNTASKDVQINVASKPVKLKINDFTADVKSGNVPLRAYFTSSVSGSPTKWIWKFEKSVAQNFKVGTATHIYNNVGVFDVTLTVKDAAGRTDTLTKKAYITVLPKLKPPKVDFSARPNVVKISKTVQFTDKSKNNPTSWTWDFGDGATSILQNPSYAYNSAGKYTVTLTVKNSAGSDVKKVKNCVTVTRK